MKQREALEHQLTALMTKAERTFRHGGTAVVPPVITKAVDDAWVALCRDRDYPRVETLVAVINLLLSREAAKFKSAPQKYIERSKELAAA